MTGTLADRIGFAHPNRRAAAPRRYSASLEVMACMALVISTMVAATVVSIGIAPAEVPEAAARPNHSNAPAQSGHRKAYSPR